ncbi:MAG: NUDIX hydrolase [Lachnospiraceae bacterium]|nr:NUDIX hydrolase [Lachnospiraceae bacterium]
MKFKGIRKREEGKFITRYDIAYETVDKKEKIYEIISRSKSLDTLEALNGKKPDSVVIIAEDSTGERLLINREFRMAVGEWVYNFPAGLIDEGENPYESARRELWEETGLELYEIDSFLGPSYGAVGFSNEINVCVVGKARGTFRASTSSVEEIEPKWCTRAELRELLKTERFAARTQAYCYLWSGK